MEGLYEHTDSVNELLARYGVKFGIYKDGEFKEQLFPFDPIPRIIERNEFDKIRRGLMQRVSALNMFLQDVYGKKHIINDKVVPAEMVYTSPGYLAECEGICPPNGVYNHISGIDLVQGKDGVWYVLEDNIRVPSGASYPMIAREICRRSSPDTFIRTQVADNRNYISMLRQMMDDVNTGGLNVILSPGRYNAAYFEHSYLAEGTGAVLSTGNDIFVEGNVLYYKDYAGKKQRVGALYRRISDEYLDPLCFRADSVIGIPNLMQVYRSGNIAIINAPGNGVADDKGIYYYVPEMIRYYLGEEPVLTNANTYLMYNEDDRKYAIEHFDELVIKDVSEAGGYGVVFGNSLSAEKKQEYIDMINSEPRRFIAQDVIDFKDIDILENGELTPRKADLRAFVILGNSVDVWESGLTRFSRDPHSFIVNSSQGGGFKDTWVLSQ